MKIRYWGTSAAEGIPAVFCNCAICQEARKKKGKHIRTRSQMMIENTLLIDFGADTYAHSLKYGYNLSKLQSVLITHTHEDHYYPSEFLSRQKGFCHGMQAESLQVYGSKDVPDVARKVWKAQTGNDSKLLEQNRLNFVEIKPYETVDINGIRVTALPAVHNTPNPYVYIVEKDKKTVLLFNDSGLLKEETMRYLREKDIRFDLVSYDCTWGKNEAGLESAHMGVPENIIARNRFIENGNYKKDTYSVITHFSHNIPGVGYDDMLKTARDNDFILAYDGMEIEI